MNDMVQNKIVEQKDIMKIINILNDFYKEKQEIFDKTKAEIELEEQEYSKWNQERYASNDFANHPKFQFKTHNNKLTYQSFTFSFHCPDGTSYEDKSYVEAQTIMASGFDNYEKISVRLDIAWHKTYNHEEFHYEDSNNAGVTAHITFYEDDVYVNYSSRNADGDMNYIKSEISDVFDSLKPKYTSIISKRESIKFKSTLSIAYFISAAILVALTFMLKSYEIVIDFKWWQLITFPILSLLLNMFIPPIRLKRLYKQIIPKQKTVYSGREVTKVDNVKEFKRTSEVQIGKSALKAGKREQIMAIYKKSKISNAVTFVLAVLVLFFICAF